MRSITAVFLFILGCGTDNGLSRMRQVDQYTQMGSDEVDILWIVDNSISMAQEQERVANGFEAFIDAVGRTTVDFHIAVVTTDMDLDNETRGRFVGDPPFLTPEDDYVAELMSRVQLGTDGSDKERGLQAALNALSGNAAQETNGGFLRGEGAILGLLFVSDENDCSDDNALADSVEGKQCYQTDQLVPVEQYVSAFQGLKGPDGRVVVSSIVGPDAAKGCEDTWPGKRYTTVTELLDGFSGNICETDYALIMEDMGSRIAGPTRVFELTYIPLPDSIEVKIDDILLDEDPIAGWQYMDSPPSIHFDGEYYPVFGTIIEVSYVIAGNLVGETGI